MPFTQIRYEPGRVARVVMDRPRYRNAQSATLLRELDEAFTRAAEDRDVRVIVLAGEGETFSAGHDQLSQTADEQWGRKRAKERGEEPDDFEARRRLPLVERLTDSGDER